MTKKHLYFALCCAGLLINILSLFEITERFYEKKDVGENFFSLVNPGIFSYIFIAINVGLLITGLMLYIKSSFPKKHSGLLIIVAIAALCAGIIRLLSNDHENPTSVDGPSLLIYIIGFAVLANLKRKKVVTSGFFLLLLMPLSGKAQNFGSAKLDLFGNSQAAYGIRPSGYFFAPLQRSTFMATGETLILFGEEPNLSEALFMCGNLWSIQSAELGFLVGVFLEPTEVSEHESEYEGPVRGGPGAMLV